MGVSSGTNVWAAIKVAEQMGPGKTIVTVLPDGGERYLTAGLVPGEAAGAVPTEAAEEEDLL